MLKIFRRNGNQKGAKLSLGGQEETLEWQGQKIVYSVQGQGRPLILFHGINAASWGFEFRNNIESLSQNHRIYQPDLPGFGRSERLPKIYTAEMYIEFLKDFTRLVVEREGQPPAVIASSLTAAHLIGAVAQSPELFGPLVLISPTGLERLDTAPTEKQGRLYQRLNGPLGDVIFWLLGTRFSTRLFLGRDGYFDPKYMDAGLIEGYHKSARQPNAKYAPISFITFLLNHSVRQEWPEIRQPVLIVWGKEAKITPLRDAYLFLQLRLGTELKIIDHARLSVYDERSVEFNALVQEWLGRQSATRQVKPIGAKAS